MPAQPALPPAVRATVAGLLQDARASYRLARRHPRHAADLLEEGDAARDLARAIRCGAAHGRDAYGWPYLITTPVHGLTTTLED